MKKQGLCNFLSLLLVLSAPLLSVAQGRNSSQDGKKTKVINRSYTVTADDKLEIDNQFGDVTVSTWDQNKITVDIEIGARASTDEKTQDILDLIEVKEDKGDHRYSFRTKVGEIHSHGGSRRDGSGDNRTFYIDYVIHMPAGNPLDVHNDFGHTEIPDFKGPVNLTSKYGSLVAGNLSNVGTIDVEFGRATIGDINNGKVIFQYNSASRIGNINGSVRINSEFSSRVQIKLGESLKDLTVNESYSGIRMVVDKNVSAQINIHTNFGEFRNESEFSIKEQHEDEESGPKFDRDYSGTLNDGKAQIKVKSEFGSLRLTPYTDNDNNNDDRIRQQRRKARDKDKDKEKDKDKDNDSDNAEVSVS